MDSLTRANIEFMGARAVDLPVPEAHDTQARLRTHGRKHVGKPGDVFRIRLLEFQYFNISWIIEVLSSPALPRGHPAAPRKLTWTPPFLYTAIQ